jgi:hypothetical protein
VNHVNSQPDPIAATQEWLDRAVIGLNLCPFAKAPRVQGRIRFVESLAQRPQELLRDLERELLHLQASDGALCETTLLIHPLVLHDFLDYNDFLGEADALVQELGLEGELQIASFHPQFQFAGTRADDMGNFTNRSPHPTLHILRESSIDKAVAAFAQAETIYERNIETLEQLGRVGWDNLWK